MMFWMGSVTAQTMTKFSYEVTCTETAYMFKGLKEEFNESPFATATVQDNIFLVFWKSPAGGVTVTISSEQSKRSCVLVDGENFKLFDNKGNNSANPTRLH